MSRKRKKSEGSMQRSHMEDESSYSGDMMGRAESAMDAVEEHVSSHVGLWTGIAIAAGAAIYLLGTEHGRRTSRQIGDTLGDGFNSAKDVIGSNFTRLKDTATDMFDRTMSRGGMMEGSDEVERLRRIG